MFIIQNCSEHSIRTQMVHRRKKERKKKTSIFFFDMNFNLIDN